MNIMTEFIMVRHGEPDYNVVEDWAGIAVAKNFAPLTERGVSQIRRIRYDGTALQEVQS